MSDYLSSFEAIRGHLSVSILFGGSQSPEQINDANTEGGYLVIHTAIKVEAARSVLSNEVEGKKHQNQTFFLSKKIN